MPERIHVGVAWPYANGPIHMGHLAGCYLPADIFARYHRILGNDVVMVSGSDQHGTPVTVRAEQEGVSPAAVAARFHAEFLDTWQRMGISFDLFTTTGTENHKRIVHDMFLNLRDKGYIDQGAMPLMYCSKDARFLPDRYVTGTCPNCASTHARGDQCDECGRPLNGTDLVDPQCVFCGARPEVRDSDHYFLKLSAFNQQLLDWVRRQQHWRPNVLNFTERFLEDGLHDRAITRDIEWGVPLPPGEEGWDHKRIYVWFEAVIGYLSATVEWAERQGAPERWKDFWFDQNTKVYNFIGKDNIPFHTIIWPAMLMGYGGYNLPYDVPANEFLSIEGKQFSTSRNWAVWANDYLERYDPDPLRFLLSANMPETGDSDFSWRELVRRNNDELVATYGNLAHRVLTFTYRNFDKQVPQPGPLDDTSAALIRRVEEAFSVTGDHLAACHFREALRSVMAVAQDANRYLDERAPWKTLKEDRTATATSLYTALVVIAGLKQLFYPFLPFSAQKLHGLLGRAGSSQDEGWRVVLPVPGEPLPEPSPLFVKLDDAVIEMETAKLGQSG